MTVKPFTSIYLDASVLSIWVLIRESRGRKRKLQPRGEKCKKLMEDIKQSKYNCKFLTSDWALAEMVQSVRDREILDNFLLDGHEISAFNRVKAQYKIEDKKRTVIHQAINDFHKFLNKQHVQIVKANIDVYKVHEYCLKYSLETPDATHVHTAIQQSCSYLVTTDRPLIEAKVSEIDIIDPATIPTKTELRWLYKG